MWHINDPKVHCLHYKEITNNSILEAVSYIQYKLCNYLYVYRFTYIYVHMYITSYFKSSDEFAKTKSIDVITKLRTLKKQ